MKIYLILQKLEDIYAKTPFFNSEMESLTSFPFLEFEGLNLGCPQGWDEDRNIYSSVGEQ